MWDYYKDKTLKSLCLAHEFDFDKVSVFFTKNYSATVYTPEACKARWTYLYKLEKDGGEQLTDQSPMSKLMKKLTKSQGELAEGAEPQPFALPTETTDNNEYAEYLKQKEQKEREFLNEISRRPTKPPGSDGLLM